MRVINCVLTGGAFFAIYCAMGCGQNNLLGEMKKVVPIYEGANVLKSYMPTDKMSVIQLEIDASKASQEEILGFYEDAMTKQGWKSIARKNYGRDGSVMEFGKADFGSLSIQTITRNTDKTGIISVVLNLSKE